VHANAPRHKKKPRLMDSVSSFQTRSQDLYSSYESLTSPFWILQSIEYNREEMEQMKVDYKTRMMDARHQKLSEEQRKEALDRARNGIARPFGSTCKCLVGTPIDL
jgi:hypothetical protein